MSHQFQTVKPINFGILYKPQVIFKPRKIPRFSCKLKGLDAFQTWVHERIPHRSIVKPHSEALFFKCLLRGEFVPRII